MERSFCKAINEREAGAEKRHGKLDAARASASLRFAAYCYLHERYWALMYYISANVSLRLMDTSFVKNMHWFAW